MRAGNDMTNMDKDDNEVALNEEKYNNTHVLVEIHTWAPKKEAFEELWDVTSNCTDISWDEWVKRVNINLPQWDNEAFDSGHLAGNLPSQEKTWGRTEAETPACRRTFCLTDGEDESFEV